MASRGPSQSNRFRRGFRRGIGDVWPIVVSVVPFGLVAGIAAIEAGLTTLHAVAFSVGIFAGASQLAALDLLGRDAPFGVAIATALVINARMLMYSAALAPWLADVTLPRRAGAAYLLTDQAFALSVTRYAEDVELPRIPYYLGVAVPLWVFWQIATIVGAVAGRAIPEDIPLGFAVPLVFLVLLVPSVTDRPTLVAAVVGGAVALAGAGLPANLGMLLGAGAGIAAGASVAHWRRS